MLIMKMTENSLQTSGVPNKEILSMDSQFKNAKCTSEIRSNKMFIFYFNKIFNTNLLSYI